MKEVSEKTGELFQAMQPKNQFNGWNPKTWVTSLLDSLGLIGWGKRLVNIGLMTLCGFLILMMGLAIGRCMISRLLSSIASVRYVWITTVEEDLGESSF